MSNKKLVSIEDFNEIKDKDVFFIFKHSTTCPISGSAFEEWNNFNDDFPHAKYYSLFVQEARELSNYIAESYNVKHESPQVLLVKNGEVVWHTSHWKITYSNLQDIWNQHFTN
ncbi:thioredoxin family protein [Lottiidibacillus patelloidae]|uniref:Thioredoxin family protein n=1 Tax=Lottiidibacillus patelloidae TaxID=2670334 RepID=A0A263BQV0_9BACI|nr:bacillithiol system redox-active protein YtxJ [Lottiidibacillus patelloidae]OZM56074.1 thioredoxin family protein [Lottiidibacillus patelloidae]